MSQDIELEEIKRWLDSIADAPADAAARAYMIARRSHRGGELPKWCRVQWSQLPTDYRDFLASIARMGMEYTKTMPRD